MVFKHNDSIFVFLMISRQPMDPERRNSWMKEIEKYQKIDLNFVLCQLHFDKEHLYIIKNSNKAKLKRDAIPTIFTTSQPKQPPFVFDKCNCRN